MPFLFGPIVPVELVTTARRRRHYVVRVLYATVFLIGLGMNYQSHMSYALIGGGELTINEMAQFAQSFFDTFMLVQLTAVLLLTPAYVAPALADEKERRTLEYLLTTDLRNRELVFGKLLVRFGHMALYLLAGVPILTLTSWFGGISFELLLHGYALTLLTMVALACGSMFASVYTSRVRDGVVRTYVMCIALLVFPPLAQALTWSAGIGGSSSYSMQVLQRITGELLLVNPYWIYSQSIAMAGAGGYAWHVLARSALSLGLFSVFCLVVSVLRVRRVYLKQTYGKQKRSGRAAALRGISTAQRTLHAMGLETAARGVARLRPPLGARPMLWKELFATEGTRGGWVVGGLLAICALGMLAWSGWYFVQIVFDGWFLSNSGSTTSTLREGMNWLLRIAGTAIAMVLLLVVAVRSSTAVTTERERQTWDGLIAAPLEPREIVLGKFAGALWAGRWLAVMLLLCWSMGVIAGSLDPLAFLALWVELAVYACFAAALGLHCSLGMNRSGGAMAAVLGIGVYLGGGYLMCCSPVLLALGDEGQFIVGVSFPLVMGLSAATPDELSEFFDCFDEVIGVVLGSVIMLAVYTALALALLAHCIADFNRLAGRLRATRPQPPRPPTAAPPSATAPGAPSA